MSLSDMIAGFFRHDSEYAILLLNGAQQVLQCNIGAQTMFAQPRELLEAHPCPFRVSPHGSLSENVLLVGTVPEAHTDFWSYDTVLTDANGRAFPAHVSVSTCGAHDNSCPEEHLLVIIKDTSVETAQDRLRNIILEVAHLANQPKDLLPMLDDIMHVLRTTLDIPFAYVCLSDDGEQFHVAAHSGLRACAMEECCHAGAHSVETRAAGCMEACTDFTISHEPLFRHRISDCYPTPDQLHEPMELIHVPLLSDEAIMGVLHVAIPNRLLHTYIQDSQVLSLISNKLTSSIRNKQLEKALHDYAEDLERVVQMRTDQLREKDAQLVQSGKLATLGEMATGIAHEINQPLGGISLMTQGIQRALDKGKLTDDLLADRLHSIHEQIERINKIINHLRVFGRQAPEAKSPIGVNKPLHDVLELIGMQLRNHNIELVLELDESLPPILGDANRLEQVYLNIIGNARDALEDQEARVNTLRASGNPPAWTEAWHKRIHIRSFLKEGMVTVTLTDTAGGIPAHVVNKIFEPFFTTKEVGKGTGLGLSISYGIIKEFNGDLRVRTGENAGSTFIIELPPMAQPSAEQHPLEQPSMGPEGVPHE